MRAIYLSPDEADTPPPPFRTGEAGTLDIDESGGLETRSEVLLSANTVHALLGHGVVDELNALPIEGRIGSGLDALIPPSVLDAARSIFYEADRCTYGGRWEFVVDQSGAQGGVEYRVHVDNREYQAGLARLQYLSTLAGHQGLAVWIRI
ncbi:MAG: hypothetical protein JRG92_10770 [Deltaproteobacteria bacterium]|nr:hypothetical protein [Deltaproteobacteria bacterium]MBW2384108.1 hypothetical protein [Deltaproteobacteria bacterium]MBW2697079.1 hypothetical protein [Deltaproteobacteria bacterium]